MISELVADPIAEEPHTLHQRAIGDARRGEDEIAARGEVFGLVDAAAYR